MGKVTSYGELEQRVKELEKEVVRLRKADEAVRESGKRLSEIVHGSSIATFVINHEHIITHCNRAFETLTGISATELIGTRNQWRTFYPKQRPVMADFIVDGMREEDIARYYTGKYRKSAVTEGGYEAEDFFPAVGEDGKWVFFTAAPLKDAEGRIIGAIETLQDVTERRRAEEALRESERRYRTLLDFVPYPIVVFTLDGKVTYLNPAFTETFGWTLGELEGRKIPYVPPGLEEEASTNIKKLFEETVILKYETKRLTKDGRTLDVIMRGAIYSETGNGPGGELIILRDVTQEKRLARSNEAMLRMSRALPEYPDLEKLLNFVNNEVKRLLGTEGGVVILLDEASKELYFLGAAYDNTVTQKKVKEIRFALDELVAGQVIKTGEPMIVSDTSKDPLLHQERDRKLGYHTKNLLLVPLRTSDRIIGVLCAINKKEGGFDQTDVELLNMIAGTVSLSIENARFSEELKRAYRELVSLNRAKDKVINHLSHELKTPISVLSGSLNVLEKRMVSLPEERWKATFKRVHRNLDRLVEIQEEVEDIMQDRHYEGYSLLSQLLEECTDELETLITEEVGETPIIERIRDRIEENFGPKEAVPEEVHLDEYVKERLENLKTLYAHRQVEVISSLEPAPPIYIPLDPLQKVIDGLVKNAIENTPDEGKVEVTVQRHGKGAQLIVHDYGVGITQEARKRIFEGFYTTQDTLNYSSKRPFDFNAGGKGADLLRMKIFSERYNFKIDMESSRCRFIPNEGDPCPGRISRCVHCSNEEDCRRSGETTFSVYFPPAPQREE